MFRVVHAFFVNVVFGACADIDSIAAPVSLCLCGLRGSPEGSGHGRGLIAGAWVEDLGVWVTGG